MRRILLSLLTLCAVAASTLAQSNTGRLVGTISGPDGVIQAAVIVLKDNKTGKEQTIKSNDEGAFTISQLEVGEYTVTISVQGFKTFVVNNLKIDVGREYALNPTLEIGNISESVTVIAGTDILNSTSAEVSNTVSRQQILSLPLDGRNPLNLITLQAGTASNGFQLTSINGLRTTFTNITRDGINIQDTFIRTNATDFAPGRPSVEDTGEFTITTSNSDADQGYGGAQIRLVTPRGDGSFHGSLFEFNRNSALAANDFFNNSSGTPIPFRNRHQFGGRIGGPFPLPHFGEGDPSIIKDKMFFFFSYERLIDPVSVIQSRTILTPSARNGAFNYNRATAGAPNSFCPSGAAGSVCTIPNILTFAGLPGTIDPVVQSRILDDLPAVGNRTDIGDGLNTTGLGLNRQANQDRNTYTGRIDYDINEKHSINGVYSFNKEANLRTDVDPTGFSTTPDGVQTSANKTLALAYRTNIRSNFVNEVRGGFFFSSVPFDRESQVQPFFLTITAATGALISNPENNFLHQDRKTKGYNFQDNADLIVGKHSLRFGGLVQLFQVDSTNAAGTVANFTLGTNANTPRLVTPDFTAFGGISNAQLATANSLLGLLGGIVSSGAQSFNTESQTSGFTTEPSFQDFRYNDYALYLQDRYRITPNLSLTLGVRYDLFTPLRINNGLALEPVIPDGVDPATALLNPAGTYNFVGGNAGGDNRYYKPDKNNFAPTFGFAYTPNFKNKLLGTLFGAGRTVIRGGFSQVFGNDSIVTSINNAAIGNVGLGTTTSGATNAAGTTTLINARLDALPSIIPPQFITPPRTFLQNNTAQFGNFGTVFAIDPNLQTPRVSQYSFGIQRELGSQTAVEIRYVGSRSSNLARGVDLNQIDIRDNGFIDDFNRARQNLAINPTNPNCFPAPGCQQLTVFSLLAGPTGNPGTLNGTSAQAVANRNFLTNGTPADLAFNYIALGQNGGPTIANPTAPQLVNFRPNPATGAVDFFTNQATYHYNSLQVEFRRRFAQGLYFQANYTFSKNLTNAIGTSQGLFEPFLDNRNPDLDNARADYDQTHVFNFNSTYELPFGRGKKFFSGGNGFVDRLISGFQISPIIRWASGVPITFIDTRGTLNRTGRSGRQTPNSSLTNDEIKGLVGIFDTPNGLFFIDPSVISATGRASEGFASTPFDGQVFFNTDPGQTGNLARTIINSPGNFNLDISLSKIIRITENTRIQIRFEAFNALNNVNLFPASQLQSITSPTFGQLVQSFGARVIQFSARFDF